MSWTDHMFRDPVGYLTLISLILEIISWALVLSQHGSVCIQAREISINCQIFLILIYTFIFPDMFLLIMHCITDHVAIRPFGIVYEFSAALITFAASIVLLSGLTFCGNIAQIFLCIAGVAALISAITHAVSIPDIKKRLPSGVVFSDN